MKQFIVFVFFLSVALDGFSQKDSQVLVTIDGNEITVGEFKKVYEKNLSAIDTEEGKDVAKNLELYINYTLKVREAYKLNLDTLESYKREIETYKNQLISPYLQDKEFLENLIREAYERTKNEVRASHILIRFPKKYTPKDTLEAHRKIMSARKRIVSGEPFEKVAKEVSEDPSASTNGGDLGYFGAFKMLYEFEKVAYETKEGEVSMPFRTRYGYHILKNTGRRTSLGEVEVAHILITDTTTVGKKKIEDIYQKVQSGKSFKELAKEYSNDTSSKNRGGVLRKFGTGRMIKSFEKAAFSLEKVGDVSKPFRTSYGWHMVTLIKKYPVGSFEEMKKEIEEKVSQSGRARLSDKVVLDRLKNKYTIVEDPKGKLILNRQDIRAIPKDSLQNTLLVINDKSIRQFDFVSYIQNRRHLPVASLFQLFIDQEVLNYYKENLVNTEPAFAFTLKEYEDGLLLFELMQRKIWNPSNDSIALQDFYNQRKHQYQMKDLSSVRGQVINDFQNHLERKWTESLRSQVRIKINDKALKKIVKYYRKES